MSTNKTYLFLFSFFFTLLLADSPPLFNPHCPSLYLFLKSRFIHRTAFWFCPEVAQVTHRVIEDLFYHCSACLRILLLFLDDETVSLSLYLSLSISLSASRLKNYEGKNNFTRANTPTIRISLSSMQSTITIYYSSWKISRIISILYASSDFRDVSYFFVLFRIVRSVASVFERISLTFQFKNLKFLSK